jgi:hypothetical protein
LWEECGGEGNVKEETVDRRGNQQDRDNQIGGEDDGERSDTYRGRYKKSDYGYRDAPPFGGGRKWW